MASGNDDTNIEMRLRKLEISDYQRLGGKSFTFNVRNSVLIANEMNKGSPEVP